MDGDDKERRRCEPSVFITGTPEEGEEGEEETKEDEEDKEKGETDPGSGNTCGGISASRSRDKSIIQWYYCGFIVVMLLVVVLTIIVCCE